MSATKSMRKTRQIPRPFLKWVGGKGQLLPELVAYVQRAAPFGRYHEPFVGGGALFFELARQGRLDGHPNAFLSDNNLRLIEAYQCVQTSVEPLLALLRMHKARHCKEYYYAVRAEVPDTPLKRTARLLYLNKTCFNGLYRENSKGEFNVPMGKYTDPRICDVENLRAAAHALGRAEISQRHFRCILEQAEPGDFVYFDPPYHPVSATSSFTRYEQKDFGPRDQEELAEVCVALHERGVKFLLSNSYTPFILKLYDQPAFTLREVFATRAINSKAERRGKVSEVLVSNF